jgi:hypothetical protein
VVDPRASTSLTHRLMSWFQPSTAEVAGPSKISPDLLNSLRNRTPKTPAS